MDSLRFHVFLARSKISGPASSCGKGRSALLLLLLLWCWGWSSGLSTSRPWGQSTSTAQEPGWEGRLLNDTGEYRSKRAIQDAGSRKESERVMAVCTPVSISRDSAPTLTPSLPWRLSSPMFGIRVDFMFQNSLITNCLSFKLTLAQSMKFSGVWELY